ncbi:hypothetical protein MIR68_002204 [Amoeboaphelidium protococcarum]|nr:hypothetical protein MIR68_002204 [Amoeboaphelidium protococcarum]
MMTLCPSAEKRDDQALMTQGGRRQQRGKSKKLSSQTPSADVQIEHSVADQNSTKVVDTVFCNDQAPMANMNSGLQSQDASRHGHSRNQVDIHTDATLSHSRDFSHGVQQLSLCIVRHFVNFQGHLRAKVDPLYINWSIKTSNAVRSGSDGHLNATQFEQHRQDLTVQRQDRKQSKLDRIMKQHEQENQIQGYRGGGVSKSGSGWDIHEADNTQHQTEVITLGSKRLSIRKQEWQLQANVKGWNHQLEDDVDPSLNKEPPAPASKQSPPSSPKRKYEAASGQHQSKSPKITEGLFKASNTYMEEDMLNNEEFPLPGETKQVKTRSASKRTTSSSGIAHSSTPKEVAVVAPQLTQLMHVSNAIRIHNKLSIFLRKSSLDPILFARKMDFQAPCDANEKTRIVLVKLHNSTDQMLGAGAMEHLQQKKLRIGSHLDNLGCDEGVKIMEAYKRLSERLYWIFDGEVVVAITWCPPEDEIKIVNDNLNRIISKIKHKPHKLVKAKNTASDQVDPELLPSILCFKNIFESSNGSSTSASTQEFRNINDHNPVSDLGRFHLHDQMRQPKHWNYFLSDAENPAYFFAPFMTQENQFDAGKGDGCSNAVDGHIDGVADPQQYHDAVAKVSLEERFLAELNMKDVLK